jgi:hypothetical protein
MYLLEFIIFLLTLLCIWMYLYFDVRYMYGPVHQQSDHSSMALAHSEQSVMAVNRPITARWPAEVVFKATSSYILQLIPGRF